MMNGCRIEQSQNGFKVLGLINFETVMHIYQQGAELLNACDRVHLDFAQVSHADSTAIALLLSWLRCARKRINPLYLKIFLGNC